MLQAVGGASERDSVSAAPGWPPQVGRSPPTRIRVRIPRACYTTWIEQSTAADIAYLVEQAVDPATAEDHSASTHPGPAERPRQTSFLVK